MSSFWDDAAGVLGKVAPLLATAVGGPLAGTAVSAIVGALGLAPDTPREQVAAAVAAATPEQLLALQKANQEFAETMAKLKLDTDKLTYDDRADARDRETKVKDRTPANLAYIAITGFLVVSAIVIALAVTASKAIDGAAWALIGSVVTMFSNEVKQSFAYYFGTSADSDAKTSLIYNSTPTKR